jgi:hypothetical protein
MYVLVSIVEEDEDEAPIVFEGAFADKEAATAALPAAVSGVSINDEDGEPVQFDASKHEIELEACDEFELAFGETPTEQLEVLVNFGEDSEDEDAVATGYYLIGFGAH